MVSEHSAVMALIIKSTPMNITVSAACRVLLESQRWGFTLQVNLFIAVLKIKFAKAQTLFHSKLAKMSRKKRKNMLGRVMEKSKNRIKDQVKKRREASEVRDGVAAFYPLCNALLPLTDPRGCSRLALTPTTQSLTTQTCMMLLFTCTDQLKFCNEHCPVASCSLMVICSAGQLESHVYQSQHEPRGHWRVGQPCRNTELQRRWQWLD